MFIHLAGLFIFIYIFIRLIRPLPLGRCFKLSYAGIALLATQIHLIQRFLLGGLAAPEVPGWLIMTMGWAFSSMLILACTLLLRDALFLLSYVFTKGDRIRHAILSPLNSSFMLMFSTFICAVGVWRAVSFPSVTHLELEFDKLPSSFDGYRIVHMTDLHASRLLPESWQHEVMLISNYLKPDLVLITGDLIDGTPEKRRHDIRAFKYLNSNDGVFVSLGNHEYYSGLDSWIESFEKINLSLLMNENTRIKHGADEIVIAGITDITAERFDKELPDIDKALEGTTDEEMIILMSHRPINTQAHADKGVSLQLSGHTHGGQIIGLNIVTKLANEGFLMGLYKINDMFMYLNRGAGLWGGLPIRIGVNSEIVDITLRSTKKVEADDDASTFNNLNALN